MARSAALECLPSELLVSILVHVFDHETPFWIDKCLQLPRHRLDHGVPRPEVVVKQDVHRKDWLMVNSTCRRFRSIGKILFFQTKTFVMTLNMHEKLSTGTSWLDLGDQERETALRQYKGDEEHALKERWCALSAQDHKIALSYIEHIVLSGALSPYVPNEKTTMSKIPKLLSTFPALRQCDLIIWDEIRDYQLYLGYQEGDDDQQDNHAQRETGVGMADDLREIASNLENIMKRCGMGKNIRLGLCL
ncbi:hypothetical protein ACHAP8_003879 [Fusarium lateritium]